MTKIRVLSLSGDEISAEFGKIGVHSEGIRLMEPKSRSYVVKLNGVNVKQANIIKQEALSTGADAAIPYAVLKLEDREVDIIIMATVKQYGRLAEKLSHQAFGLKSIGSEILRCIENYHSVPVSVKSRLFSFDAEKPLVMGILNVTPDSFSDGGKYLDHEKAYQHAVEMVKQGADILDIGGESTRPGAEPVGAREEITRILPVIREVVKKLRIPVSCDTSRACAAEKALEEGAVMINDVYSLRRETRMAAVVKNAGCPVILMHMLGTPETMQKGPRYDDVILDICDFFRERMEYVVKNGIAVERVILDPGMGFGKRVQDNLEIIKRLREFTCFGRPILLGPSRKRFLGDIAGKLPATERVPGTIASCVVGYMNGARLFRVHDVKEVRLALDTAYHIDSGFHIPGLKVNP